VPVERPLWENGTVWLKASFLLWTGAFVGGLQLLWVPGCTVAVVVAAGVVHVFCQQFCKIGQKKIEIQFHSSNPTSFWLRIPLLFASPSPSRPVIEPNVFYRKLLSQLRWRGTRA